MTVTSDEVPGPAEALENALIAFTGCIGAALPDVCSYGITIGESYVPFNPDPEDECEDDDIMCSQAWVRVMQVTPKANGTDGWGGECDLVLEAELEVGVVRCFDVPEDGEAPTASETLVAAMQAMSDMNAVHAAAMACEVWDGITTGSWQPSGPLGGQYGGTWTFTVELDGGCLPADTGGGGIGRICGMWTGNGAPGDIPGSLDGDEYLDLVSGNIYTLSV